MPIVSRSKSKWYRAQKVQKYALNSQLQALQILTNDDEVENWSLSSFLLAVNWANKKSGPKTKSTAAWKGTPLRFKIAMHFTILTIDKCLK